MLKSQNGRKAIALCFGLLALSQPAVAGAPDWIFVTNAVRGTQKITVQVDLGSMKRDKSVVRYWVRYLDTEKAWDAATIELMLDGTSAVIQGPSLYQSNCATDQTRLLQGQVVFGYEGPLVPLSRPANWEYPPPGSLASIIHKFACSNP